MPDDVTVDTGEPQDSSAEGNDSGGAAQSHKGGDATDWKAKFKELEKAYQRETGKAGTLKQTLTDQLTAAIQESSESKAKVVELSKQLQQRDVLDEVLSKAPEKQRGAVKLAAKGILPEVDLSDPTKAVEAVINKITADAPDLFAAKPNPIQHMPHDKGDRSSKVGFAFTRDGKRLI